MFFRKIVFSNLLLYLIQKYILNAFFRFRPSTWLKSIICQKMREFERTVFETLRGQFLLTSASKMKIGVKNRILWKMKTISLFISNLGNRMHEMLFWHILYFRNFSKMQMLAFGQSNNIILNNTPNYLKIGTHVQNYKNNRKILLYIILYYIILLYILFFRNFCRCLLLANLTI